LKSGDSEKKRVIAMAAVILLMPKATIEMVDGSATSDKTPQPPKRFQA
jgi:hypothetical protein